MPNTVELGASGVTGIALYVEMGSSGHASWCVRERIVCDPSCMLGGVGGIGFNLWNGCVSGRRKGN